MKQPISSFAAATGVLAGAALLVLLTGCETDGSARVTLQGDVGSPGTELEFAL